MIQQCKYGFLVALLCASSFADARVIVGVSAGQSGLSKDVADSVLARERSFGSGFVTLGYQLTAPWSVNVRYGVLMDESVSDTQKVKLTTGAILHRYDVLPTSRWDAYGMMGVSYNEQEVSGPALNTKKELKRVSPVGGVGVGYHVGKRQTVGLEAVMYTKDTWATTVEYRYRFPNKTIETSPDWQALEARFDVSEPSSGQKVDEKPTDTKPEVKPVNPNADKVIDASTNVDVKEKEASAIESSVEVKPDSANTP